MYAKDNLDMLKVLNGCKCPKQKSQLVNCCNKDQIGAICECADNLLRGNVPLTPQQKKRLRKHKTTIRKLASKKIRWKRKKKFIMQKGGGLLTTILGVAVPALVSLFSR